MKTPKINWKLLVISLGITFGVSILSTFLTSDSAMKYQQLEKPPLSPPSEIFGIVWPILFFLMSISLYLVLNSNASKKEKHGGAILYGIQLFLNFFWTLIYFNLDAKLLAFVWLILLLVVVVIMAVDFYNINKLAGILLIPYILWLLFAGYLNLATYLIN